MSADGRGIGSRCSRDSSQWRYSPHSQKSASGATSRPHVAQLRRERGAARALGQHDLPVADAQLPRRLLPRALTQPGEDVVVELVDRDVAVLVDVGLAGAQALDEVAGEQRSRPGAELADI